MIMGIIRIPEPSICADLKFQELMAISSFMPNVVPDIEVITLMRNSYEARSVFKVRRLLVPAWDPGAQCT